MTQRYNLVLCHIPERQQVSDYLTIRNIMLGRAPDIDVHVISIGEKVPSDFWQRMAERPTLIFSIGAIRIDPLIRGTRLVSKPLTKMKEMDIISAAGLPVPEARLITPELKLDEDEWGTYTVIKPNSSMKGRGVYLSFTKDVRWIDTEVLARSDPRYGQQLIAQRFVDSGPYVTSYRVMLVLGRPIYCNTSISIDIRPDLGALPDIAANGVRRKFALSYDEQVMALAVALHTSCPDIPVMGVDIIREHGTGKLYLLEFNSHGLVWHLSSKSGLSGQREFGLDYYGQFHALESIADELITATRRRAT